MQQLSLADDAVLPLHSNRVHPKTGEPLRAVGFKANGDPIWPILGAAPNDPDDEDRDDDADDSDDDDGSDDDSDDDDADDKPGKKGEEDTDSVDYWKKRSRQNEREAKKHRRENERLKKTQPDPKAKTKKKADDDGDEPDADEIRKQAREEARAEVTRDRVSDKIEAKARKFADPEDAAVMVFRTHDVDDFLDDDGKIDVEAINEALDELLEKKPYLAAASGKRFQGGGDGGGRQSKKARPKSIREAVSNKSKS